MWAHENKQGRLHRGIIEQAPQMQSGTCWGLRGCRHSEGLGQTQGAEAAFQPEWLVNTEVDSTIRGREMVQRVAAVAQLPSPGKESHRCWNLAPLHPPVPLPSPKHYNPPLADCKEEETFQPKVV